MIADCKGDGQERTNGALSVGAFVVCWIMVISVIVVILVKDGATLAAVDALMAVAVGKEEAA